ncbi:hypothetical protein B0G77_6329 [Paraburkholderia sp. BL10I2N1]|nr:hypothetical protein B0G77_6329 [Paraburkholderia sp. BL10I2N1]
MVSGANRLRVSTGNDWTFSLVEPKVRVFGGRRGRWIGHAFWANGESFRESNTGVLPARWRQGPYFQACTAGKGESFQDRPTRARIFARITAAIAEHRRLMLECRERPCNRLFTLQSVFPAVAMGRSSLRGGFLREQPGGCAAPCLDSEVLPAVRGVPVTCGRSAAAWWRRRLVRVREPSSPKNLTGPVARGFTGSLVLRGRLLARTCVVTGD